MKRACAHLVLTNTASEVLVAFPVTKYRYVGHVEDGFISSALKDKRGNEWTADMVDKEMAKKAGGQAVSTFVNRSTACVSSI